MEQLEESIGRYLAELDRADREPELTVLADRGYFKGEEILDCEQAGRACQNFCVTRAG